MCTLSTISFAAVPSIASQETQLADLSVKRCLEAPKEFADAIEKALLVACRKAFNAAIKEAQKVEKHSAAMRRMYWLQASGTNALVTLISLKNENGFTENVCGIALQGVKAWSQVDPKPGPEDIIKLPTTLSAAMRHCKIYWK